MTSDRPTRARHRCYMPEGDTDEGRCPNAATYEARLDWTFGVMLLCVDHAATERARESVTEIRSLERVEAIW